MYCHDPIQALQAVGFGQLVPCVWLLGNRGQKKWKKLCLFPDLCTSSCAVFLGLV